MSEQEALPGVEALFPSTDLPFLDNSSQTGFYLGPVRDPLTIVIPILTIYTMIFVTGLIGNAVTCMVIIRNRRMHTSTNYYLFSLAMSDLLLLVLGLPQEMYQIWSHYPYVFGEVFCVLRGLTAETSTNASVLTITAFTIERYMAVCHPFLAHIISTPRRAVRLIALIWLVAVACALPQALQLGVVRGQTPDHVLCVVKQKVMGHSFEISTFLFFVAPMTLITVLYILIGLRLRRSNRLKRGYGGYGVTFTGKTTNGASSQAHNTLGAEVSLSNSQDEFELRNMKKNHRRRQEVTPSRRVLKMLVVVVVAFFICWAPFHAQRLAAIYGEKFFSRHPTMMKIYTVLTYISGILYFLSTTINPILYSIMSHKFRYAFKETFARCCRWGNIPERKKRPSYCILMRPTVPETIPERNEWPQTMTEVGHSAT